jgi:hypothetical protein
VVLHRVSFALENRESRGDCGTSFWRGSLNLKQSLAATVHGKRECVLASHHKFQNVDQIFRFVSIVPSTAKPYSLRIKPV